MHRGGPRHHGRMGPHGHHHPPHMFRRRRYYRPYRGCGGCLFPFIIGLLIIVGLLIFFL